jgi:hypothetical protein
MTRCLHLVLAVVLLSSCGGGSGSEGDADADTTTDTVTDTPSDTPADTPSDTAPDTSDDPPADSEDTMEDSAPDTAEDPFEDPAEDTIEEDAALDCDTSKMLSAGIAPSPWTVGSFCDEVYACIASGAASSVTAIFPSAACGVTFSSCMTSAGACQVLTGGTITASQWDDLCALSLLSGVLQIYCIVYA